MTFTTDIPISGDTLGSTRDRIRGNFQEIAAVEAINHVAFNEAGKGKHKFLQMPEVTASGAGIPVTLANEAGLYVDVGTNPAEANLFFRGENNGYQYQLTRATSASTATFGTNTAYAANHLGGWTFLPGGMLFQYGLRTAIAASGTTIVTFPVQFTSACFSVNLSPITSGDPSKQMIINANAGTSSFVINNNSSTFTRAYWTAVGI